MWSALNADSTVTKEASDASFLKLTSILTSDAGNASDQLSGVQKRTATSSSTGTARCTLYTARTVAVAELRPLRLRVYGSTCDTS